MRERDVGGSLVSILDVSAALDAREHSTEAHARV